MKKLILFICALSLTTSFFSTHASEKRKKKISLALTKDFTKRKNTEDLKQAQKTIARLKEELKQAKKDRNSADEAYQEEVRDAYEELDATREECDDYKHQLKLMRIEKSTLVSQRDFEIASLKTHHKNLTAQASYTQSTLLASISSLNTLTHYQDEKLKTKRAQIAQQRAEIATLRKELEAAREKSRTEDPSVLGMYS